MLFAWLTPLKGEKRMNDDWNLYLLSHTHWDREWYFTFQQYRRRLVKLMDRLLDLFEQEPRYRYFTLDGQTLPLRDYLEIRPEREAQVRKAVSEGRLLIGPWYTQPNEFMSSGEGMIRNMILGFREAEAFGGVMRVAYLPDQFGHISQMPQFLRGFGIEDVVSWRGMPGGTKSALDWVGADGSTCHFFYLSHTYGQANGLPLEDEDTVTYIDSTPLEVAGLSKRIPAIVEALAPRATTPHLLLMNGMDHCFAQPDLPAIIDKINRTMPGLHAEHATFAEYIRAVKTYHEEHQIPYTQLRGELHDSKESWVLVDSQSTRAPVKLANDRIERLFERWLEPFSAFAWLLGQPYPQAEIWRAWEYLLQNHAHDSLACASVDPTYHQVMTRFEWAEELGEEIVGESLQVIANLVSRENEVLVFNPLSWERSAVVRATLDVPKALNLSSPRLFDGDREVPLAIQRVGENKVVHFNPRLGATAGIAVDRYEISFVAQNVPACGYRAYRLAGAPQAQALAGGLVVGPGVLENEYVRVCVNGDGTLDVTDKRSGRGFAGLHLFEDDGEAGHGFHHDAPVNDAIIYSRGAAARISLVEQAPWTAALRVEMTLDLPRGLTPDRAARAEETAPCTISSTIRLNAGSPRIDIETLVDNHAKDHRLRVTFPTYLLCRVSHAAEPWDVVERPLQLPDLNSYPDEKQSPVKPQNGFVDVSDGQAGLMIASQGLYEYEVTDTPDRRICVTLLRCLQQLHPGPFWDSAEMQMHEAQCLGTTIFRYSLIPHAGGWQSALRDAYNFRFPMRAVRQQPLEEEQLPDFELLTVVGGLPQAHSFVQVEPEALVVSAIKKHETRATMIVRLWNPGVEAVAGRLRVAAPGYHPVSAYRTNLREERQEALPLDEAGWVAFTVHGKGLLTVELTAG
jgi:mannosylglycerate hydrolase